MTPLKKLRRRKLMTAAYNDNCKGMNAHAFFKTHNHALGNDLVQDTFLKTWSYLVGGGKVEVMKAFLYHVLNHLIVDEYRKKKSSSLDALIEKGFEPGGDESEKVVDILDGRAALLLIRYLPKKYRAIIQMRYVEEMSLQEMSLITGQTKNAIAVQAYRGLIKLKLLYKPLEKK